jgi:hypothetical protein
VIVEEMETTSGTKTISFTLPYYLDVGPKFFSEKRNVLVDVLNPLETSSRQAAKNCQSHPLYRFYDAQIGRRKNSDQVSAAHPNWFRDWLACCFVGLHSVADGRE